MFGELGGVSKTLFELVEKNALHTFRPLLKKIVERRWKHAANTYVKIAAVTTGSATRGSDHTAQSVSKYGQYIRAEDTYVKRVQFVFVQPVRKRYDTEKQFRLAERK